MRLWPRSREELPKQFLSLREGNTMLQDTVERMLRVLPAGHLRAVAGKKCGLPTSAFWLSRIRMAAGLIARICAPPFVSGKAT